MSVEFKPAVTEIRTVVVKEPSVVIELDVDTAMALTSVLGSIATGQCAQLNQLWATLSAKYDLNKRNGWHVPLTPGTRVLQRGQNY